MSVLFTFGSNSNVPRLLCAVERMGYSLKNLESLYLIKTKLNAHSM